jgi:molecular chaperone GrpE
MAKAQKSGVDDKQLKALQAQVEELTNKWQRALADYDNLQKRVNAQRVAWAQLASLGVVERLLPIMDDLERAQQHLQDPGLEMVSKQLMSALEEEGVMRLDTEGKPFDPATMECVEVVEGEKDTVVKEVQAGYGMGDKVVRVAKVEVGRGKSNDK